jgi:FkbM family methyltransferase
MGEKRAQAGKPTNVATESTSELIQRKRIVSFMTSSTAMTLRRVARRVVSERLGSSGRVYTFEPLPATVAKLTAAAGGLDNVSILPVALSDHTGNAAIDPGDEDQLATARIEEGGTVPIELQTGDNMILIGAADLPAMVKIDVEGHEFEVLRGMGQVLRTGILRDIFIEVHFAIFEATGRSDKPALIERLLSDQNFNLRWIDQAHLHAYR